MFVADCSPMIHLLAGIYFSNRPDDGGQLLEVANRCQDNVAKQDGASSKFASHFASHFSVCCRVMQCAAVCCSVLQCVAVCCSVLHDGASSNFASHFASHFSVCCRVMQCAAVCCTVLQCVAVCCSVLQDGASSNFASHFASHFSPKELFWRVFYFTHESLCESLFATRISVAGVLL